MTQSSSEESDAEARVKDGLYSLAIEMNGAKQGRATGIAVLQGGRILGGDSFFYYTGSYSFSRGKWRGEMIVHQHTEAPGLILVFGGREVTCGFTGTYSSGPRRYRRHRAGRPDQRFLSFRVDAEGAA